MCLFLSSLFEFLFFKYLSSFSRIVLYLRSQIFVCSVLLLTSISNTIKKIIGELVTYKIPPQRQNDFITIFSFLSFEGLLKKLSYIRDSEIFYKHPISILSLDHLCPNHKQLHSSDYWISILYNYFIIEYKYCIIIIPVSSLYTIVE